MCGKKLSNGRVVGYGAGNFHAIVVGARRNDEGVIGELQCQHALRRRLLGEHHADAGLVGAGVAVGGVVNLEDQVGAGRNELGHAVGPAIGLAAGRIDQQHVAGGGMGFGAHLGVGKAGRR